MFSSFGIEGRVALQKKTNIFRRREYLKNVFLPRGRKNHGNMPKFALINSYVPIAFDILPHF
jgi:hypothetical protein